MVRMLLQVHALLQSTLTVTLGWLQDSGFYVDRSSGLESYVGYDLGIFIYRLLDKAMYTTSVSSWAMLYD